MNNVVNPQLVRGLLSLVMVGGLFGGFFASLSWAFARRRLGCPILPASKPRVVPWGLRTVLVVFGIWILVNIVIVMAYARGRERLSSWRARTGVASATSRTSGASPSKGGSVQREGDAPTSPDDREDEAFSFTEKMGLVSVINLVLLIVVPPVLKFESNATWSDLGIERAGLAKNVKIGVVAFFLTTPAVFATNAIAQLVFRTNKHPLELMLRQDSSLAVVIVALVSAVILAPAAEELIFRAVFQGWLIRATLRRGGLAEEFGIELGTPSGPGMADRLDSDAVLEVPLISACSESAAATVPASPPISRLPVVLTSLLFAAVHAPQMPAPIPIFFLSLVLGTLYQRTGSVIPSFVVHAMFNGFSTIILLIDMIGKPS